MARVRISNSSVYIETERLNFRGLIGIALMLATGGRAEVWKSHAKRALVDTDAG